MFYLEQALSNMVQEIKRLDKEMTDLKKVNTVKDEMSTNNYKDDHYCNDNLAAIQMLKDVSKIIESIERNDANAIGVALYSLKLNMSEFEKTFNCCVLEGLYN